MSLDLTENQLCFVKNVLRQVVPDRHFWVFGSRANGNAKKYSDLDLYVDDSLSAVEKTMAQMSFEESELPFRVDIVDRESVGAGVREKILRHALPIL